LKEQKLQRDTNIENTKEQLLTLNSYEKLKHNDIEFHDDYKSKKEIKKEKEK